LILFLSIPICKMLVLILPRESHGCNIICAWNVWAFCPVGYFYWFYNYF
jgi:hypothetical protein